MPNLKDIQRKIKSVTNTQKTTKAMKLVSTAKLKKAEEFAKKSRFYSDKLNELLSDLSYKIRKYKVNGIQNRCFKKIEDIKVVDIIFITADKGLCGGFNSQTIKAVKKLIDEYKKNNVKIRLRAIGKKGIDFFNFNNIELYDSKRELSSTPNYKEASEFIKVSYKDFINGEIDKLILVHNGYLNMISQELKVNSIFPILDEKNQDKIEASNSLIDIEAYDDEKVLEDLIEKYLEYNIYYALIDSLAAEHSSRMQAMDTATNNASDMIYSLTIKYNKARQEAITTELTEIISGVESMK